MGSATNGLIDKLSYGYEPGVLRPNANYPNPGEPQYLTMPISNKLTSVTDASGSGDGMPAGSTAYTYDGDGNLKTEGNNTYIWAATGKLKEVTEGGNAKVKYLYDAMGNRALKWTPAKAQLYMRDGSGNELISLERSTSGPILKEANIFGSERLGTYKPHSESPATHTITNRSYYLKDHLGNIRATVSDERQRETVSGSNFVFKPTILNASEYYPFGMESNAFTLAGTEGNRYGYNGKEKDLSLEAGGDVLDFGARLYDGRIGRFFKTDNFSHKFPSFSSYSYASNNVISSIDHNGDSTVYVGKMGEILFISYDNLPNSVVTVNDVDRFKSEVWYTTMKNKSIASLDRNDVNISLRKHGTNYLMEDFFMFDDKYSSPKGEASVQLEDGKNTIKPGTKHLDVSSKNVVFLTPSPIRKLLFHIHPKDYDPKTYDADDPRSYDNKSHNKANGGYNIIIDNYPANSSNRALFFYNYREPGLDPPDPTVLGKEPTDLRKNFNIPRNIFNDSKGKPRLTL